MRSQPQPFALATVLSRVKWSIKSFFLHLEKILKISFKRSFGVFGDLVKSFNLHEHQLSPFAIYEDGSVDGFLRGLATQPVQSMDSSFSEEVVILAFILGVFAFDGLLFICS